MYFSLNKKIFYTIFGLMIFTSMLFLMLFWAVFGKKYTDDQYQVFSRNQYIIDLLHENIQLQKELVNLKGETFSVQDLTEKQEKLSKEIKINDSFLRTYNEKNIAFIEGAKIIGYGFYYL